MYRIMKKVVEIFTKKYGYALNLRTDLLRARAAIYAEAMKEAGKLLKK